MKFIQVGVGGFGKTWVNVLGKTKGVALLGLVDISQKAMQQACEKHRLQHTRCFVSLPRALRELRADALVCVTPPAIHRQTIVRAMQAGLDVITEKPMADTPRDCRAILAAACKTGRICAVSQNYRHHAPFPKIAQMIRNNAIGQIGQIKIDFYKGSDFGGFRAKMDYPLITDMAIHHFDLIRYITDCNARSVSGHAWNPSWSHYAGDCSTTMMFEMKNRVRVLYNGSWCAKGSFCDWNGNWQIEGSKGTILYENGKATLLKAPKGYTTNAPRPIQSADAGESGQQAVLREFMKCCRTRKQPSTGVADNIHSVAMVFAAAKAAKTGKRIAV